jgi:hypothetical protein
VRISQVELSLTTVGQCGARMVATIASEGWDIRAELGNGEVVVKHCHDWNHVERLRSRLQAERQCQDARKAA